jgi:hypothetical protein
MKKLFTTLLIAIAALCVPTGCYKSDIGSTISPLNTLPLSDLPNITNFLVQASTAFVADAQAVVHVFSSSLGDGNFTVNYNITGNNSLSGTATLTINRGSGTFTTGVLHSAGPSTVTVTSISNAAGSSTPPTGNNVSSMFDSTGIMGATYTSGTKDTTWQFNTYQVTTQLAGSLLTINAVMWTPNLTTISLTDFNYPITVGVHTFTSASGTYAASYGVAGSGIAIADLASHGTFTITSTAPLLVGSFTYTNQDSSTVVGTFSCPQP